MIGYERVAPDDAGEQDTSRRACRSCCGCFGAVVLGVVIWQFICFLSGKPDLPYGILSSESWDGKPLFTVNQMEVPQSHELLMNFSKQMAMVFNTDANVSWFPPEYRTNMTWGVPKTNEEAMDMMYQATKVDGVWDKIPEVLRGVFWMKGNGIAEELVVFQYGRWFPNELTFLMPESSAMVWAWPEGNKSDPGASPPIVTFLGNQASNFTLSMTFDRADLSDPALKGNLFIHEHANLLNQDKRPFIFSLDAAQDVDPRPGMAWHRSARVGFGKCAFLQLPNAWGYTLVKVIDGDGSPVAPFYQQFLDHMGDTKLVLYLGRSEEWPSYQ